MNFYFVTIHYKSRISEDFGDFQYTSLLGAYVESMEGFALVLACGYYRFIYQIPKNEPARWYLPAEEVRFQLYEN